MKVAKCINYCRLEKLKTKIKIFKQFMIFNFAITYKIIYNKTT